MTLCAGWMIFASMISGARPRPGWRNLVFSPHTISFVLNHVSARKGTITAAVYVKYSYDAEKRAALDAWGKRLGQVLGETQDWLDSAIVTSRLQRINVTHELQCSHVT